MRLSTICTFGGVGAIGAGAHLFTSGEPAAAGVLAALGVVLLGLVAWAYGVRPPERIRSGSRRAAAPAFAVLLVLSIFATGPAVGALGFQDCDPSDSLISSFLRSFAAPNEEGDCRFNPDDGPDQSDYADLGALAATADETHTQYLLSQENFITDRRAVAWSEAKLETVNQLNNGSNVSTAQAAVNATIQDYYHVPTRNAFNRLSQSWSVAEYLWKADAANWSYGGQSVNVEGFVTVAYTLETGGTVEHRTMVYESNGNYLYRADSWIDTNENVTFSDAYIPAIDNSTANLSYGGIARQDVTYEGPNGNHTVLHSERHAALTRSGGTYGSSGFDSQRYQMQRNSGPFVQEVYTQYNQSELNTTDLLGAAELAGRSSTDYNSTGYYGFYSVEMATLGWQSDLNTSFSVTMNGTTYDGQVFYTGDDSVTFTNGTTYNPANYTGSFYMSHQGTNNSSVLKLDESFTVAALTNPVSGESVNETTTQNYVYKDGNASRLQQELETLAELREYLKDQQASGGGGGGWNLDLGGTQTGALIALAAVVALFALKD